MDYEEFTRQLKAELRANGVVQNGPMAGRPLMILTTTGAKSGEPRETVVTYTREGDKYVIAASKSGADTNPAWYHNLVDHPGVEIQVGSDKFSARARTATAEERPALWRRMAALFPLYDTYQAKAGREIPLVIVERI